MRDEQINNLLRDWSNDQLPDSETCNKILRNVFAHPRRRPLRRMVAAALSGIAAVATTLLFIITLPPEQPAESPIVIPVVQNNDSKVRISLIVLKQLPDSDTAVEFLEDTVFTAEKEQLHELELGGHRLFLWIYPLEERLYSLDIGIDKAAESGIAAVPDHPQALQFTSNGDRFDVFVSVLPSPLPLGEG